jgi:hypothetical protein
MPRLLNAQRLSGIYIGMLAEGDIIRHVRDQQPPPDLATFFADEHGGLLMTQCGRLITPRLS